MVYLMVEQQFAKYPWCQRTIRGIFEEVRKRRIHVQEVSELPGGAEERSCVLLVGASEEWINQTARGAGSLGLHPIVLSNRETNSSGLSVSSVKMDIHSSMELAVDYLRTLGRERLALFGVNPSASSDLWRARRFGELTGREGDVFFLSSSVNEIFDQFYEKIHRYDGVICASDYAAVSLVGRLREKNYAIPEKLYVVGYGDMFLSRLFRPAITSISDDYESFGKAALAICAMMEKNDAFSVVSVKLKSRLRRRKIDPIFRTAARSCRYRFRRTAFSGTWSSPNWPIWKPCSMSVTKRTSCCCICCRRSCPIPSWRSSASFPKPRQNTG